MVGSIFAYPMERDMATQADVIRAVNSKGYQGSLATAAHYLRDLASAVGQREAAMLFGMSSDYRKVCKAARKRLCLHNPQFDIELKAMGGESVSELPDGVSAEILARVTTNDKDWDGDIVHPDGLVFDQKGPLLWMHAQHMPIGTFAGQVSQDEKSARNRYHLSETQLALDAVKLYRIGALRNSIGFKVLEAEPLGFTDGAGGKQVPIGFDIKRAVVLENSAVAIPANPNATVEQVYAKQYEAVREAYSEKQFACPVVQKYASVIYEGRPKVFRGADVEKQHEGRELVERLGKLVSSLESKGKEVETQSKDAEVDEIKMVSVGMDNYMKGSYESAIDGIERSVKRYLCEKGGCDDDMYPHVMATYGDKAYVCMRKWTESGPKRKCYSVDYKMGDDGVEFTGNKAVKIEPSVMEVAEKHFSQDIWTKDGKTFANGELVQESLSATLESAADSADDVTRLLAKCITGEIEMGDTLKKLIGQTASLIEATDRASELSQLVEAGA